MLKVFVHRVGDIKKILEDKEYVMITETWIFRIEMGRKHNEFHLCNERHTWMP